jgi:hypothetical protein
VPFEKVAATLLASNPLGDQIGAAGRKEEAVAIVDDRLNQIAPIVNSEDLLRRLIRFNQRLAKLVEQ